MSNNTPRVSIGIPVYNSQEHIREALDSLLSQDYPNFELIISDNASTDATREICLDYAAKDNRIRYYRNERNMGMTWNMNRVLELATGEYFKWAGSHDYVAPAFISACKQILDRDSSVVMAYPLARTVDEKGEITGIVPEIIDTRALPTFARLCVVVAKVENCALLQYGLYRTAALNRCRPLTILVANDMVLVLEISVLGSIALVPEVLLYRRQFGPVWNEEEAVAKTLLRLDPEIRQRKNVRPFWALGLQQLKGVWRLVPFYKSFYWLPLIAFLHYSRWHRQLRREVRHPYSFRQHKEPEF